MSNQKELWFFCTDLIPRYGNKKFDTSWFESFFENASEYHRVVGEASVSYLYSNIAVKNILNYNPEAKFLVSLRNPIETAISAHAQEIINGQESISSFWKAWKLQEAPEKKATRFLSNVLYQRRCSTRTGVYGGDKSIECLNW
jgi:hypothetical protein